MASFDVMSIEVTQAGTPQQLSASLKSDSLVRSSGAGLLGTSLTLVCPTYRPAF